LQSSSSPSKGPVRVPSFAESRRPLRRRSGLAASAPLQIPTATAASDACIRLSCSRGRAPGPPVRCFDGCSLAWSCTDMTIARSKVTAQGQISVPAEVRKKLGIGPGSVLEWHEQDGDVVVRRAGRFRSSDIHQALFPRGAPKSRQPIDTKESIRKHVRQRHARG
jgi:antitoxin PrlF